MKKSLVWLAGIVGIICIGIAVYYWITPADSLASFMPGFDPANTAPHFKHGLAAIIVGIGLLIVAWFASGPKRV